MPRLSNLNKTSLLAPMTALVVIGFAVGYVANESAETPQKATHVEESFRAGKVDWRNGEPASTKSAELPSVATVDANAFHPRKANTLTSAQALAPIQTSAARGLQTPGAGATHSRQPDQSDHEATVDFELGEGEAFAAVDPAKPGHSVSAYGVRVAVEGQVIDFEGKPVGLEFSIGDDSGEGTDRGRNADGPDGKGGVGRRSGPYVAGFSHEDALFRMKWGWAAYDMARRAANEEAQPAQ